MQIIYMKLHLRYLLYMGIKAVLVNCNPVSLKALLKMYLKVLLDVIVCY